MRGPILVTIVVVLLTVVLCIIGYKLNRYVS